MKKSQNLHPVTWKPATYGLIDPRTHIIVARGTKEELEKQQKTSKTPVYLVITKRSVGEKFPRSIIRD